MLTVKKFVAAALALAVLLAAIGTVTPSIAQIPKPVQEVSVVNSPAVQAQQAGPWTVGAQLAAGSTVAISGTPAVSISGTPTVNVGSLPASPVNMRPALPAFPRAWDLTLTDATPQVSAAVDPGVSAIGVSSITFTNFGLPEDQVNLFGWGIQNPNHVFLVQGRSTLHLTYPTPLVFSCVNPPGCISVRTGYVLNGSSVHVAINGFAQY